MSDKKLSEIFDQWREFVRTTPDMPKDWKRGVYTFFAKDLAHNWAFSATQQVVELVRDGMELEAAIKQVDENL